MALWMRSSSAFLRKDLQLSLASVEEIIGNGVDGNVSQFVPYLTITEEEEKVFIQNGD